VVAYSGNSGGSEGPHLHFEIRDNEERPINPMLFGIDIKDTTKPIIKEVYAYPISDDAHINRTNEMCKLRLIPQQNGDYTVENITAFGTIGFGIVSTDRQDLAANNNGLYDIESFFNGQPNFEIEFSRFSFAETSHLNRYIDYGVYKTKKQRIQKLFVEKNNPLSLYKNLDNNGFLRIEDSTTSVYKIRVKDYKNNDCWLTLNIKGMKAADIKKKETPKSNYYIYADQTTTLSKDNVTVTIYPNTFYDDFPTDFEVKSDTVFINEDVYPMQKSMSIAYDVSQYDEQDKKQLYVAELVGYYKKPYYTSTKHEGNKIIGLTKYLGTYALVKDSIPPSITPNNFDDGKWLSKYRYLQLKVDDKESGISSYRATVNGKWILMEYDYKKKMLTYDFNDSRTSTENKLKVIVTDNVGNSTTFEATFFRK
ncbi:MAG: M23 family metallopeptidase, partial [Mangrovimonas sp.]|nr:M23 family metallopeptidase [Mangrovimonas sp.]